MPVSLGTRCITPQIPLLGSAAGGAAAAFNSRPKVYLGNLSGHHGAVRKGEHGASCGPESISKAASCAAIRLRAICQCLCRPCLLQVEGGARPVKVKLLH